MKTLAESIRNSLKLLETSGSIWINSNHEGYDTLYVSDAKLSTEYNQEYVGGKQYIMVMWNDEDLYVEADGNSLEELFQNWARDTLSVYLQGDPEGNYPTNLQELLDWASKSFLDKDSAYGIAIFDTLKKEEITGPSNGSAEWFSSAEWFADA